VQIDEIKLGQLQWAAASDSFEATQLAGNYSFNGRQHLVQVDNLRWAGGTYSADATLGARGKLLLEANLQGRLETAVPASATKWPLTFTASVRGPIADLTIRSLHFDVLFLGCHGFDAHRLAAGRPFVLGGVRIPFERGPLGHSDGDSLAHAVADALLGAGNLGDLGRHFPDSDPQWKDADSLRLLEACARMVREAGYDIRTFDRVADALADLGARGSRLSSQAADERRAPPSGHRFPRFRARPRSAFHPPPPNSGPGRASPWRLDRRRGGTPFQGRR